jgi:predicted AlkP superfamily pyrophosphatase or phosphodiesterase
MLMPRRRIATLCLLLVVVLALAAVGRTAVADQRPALILISLDGWRWDYDRKAPTPNLHRLIARGVQAEGLIPSYPSKTFPNHYTIVTGLYPAHHGVVGNSMWDPQLRASFDMSDRAAVADARWWGGEPLWVTVQRQGLLAATMYWPGSEAEIGGIRPRYWKRFVRPLLSNDQRVDQVLAWLDLPEAERPSFITCYFSDTDQAGHEFGPDSPQVQDAIRRIDDEIGRLTAGLTSRGLLDRVNIVTSDHGMAATSLDRAIMLSDYLDLHTVRIVDMTPTLGLIPHEGVSADDLLRKLATAPHLRVFRREETPASWHYRDNPRIPPIVGVADEGWLVLPERPKDPLAPSLKGTHGYDPAARSMHGLFVAAGPAFRRGVTVPRFENIHIYNALAAALQVQPATNDGDPAIARQLLTKQAAMVKP